MGIKVTILVAFVVVALVSVSSESIRRYKGCGSFKSKDQIQIYSPNGLSVSQKKTRKMVAFGIEVYINKPQSEPRVYNYWLNTTVVDPTSKNFTLYEPTAVIRAGDLFDYVIVKQYKRGNTRWYDCNAFRVKGSLIKEIRQGQTESYKPHADDENNKESLKTPQNNTTVNDSALITNTFVLAENADVTTESALREFIITRLTALLPLVDWNNTITEVFRWKSKFSFDVKTPEEKRKILRLLEKNKKAAEVVLNFDNMETLDNNEDYDYDEEE